MTPASARLAPKERQLGDPTTGGPPDEIVEDIRLELATLARAAQNAVSLLIPPIERRQPLRAHD